jgi:alpha-D-ribose 1-methylphosphonate 5-triphosphate diphosphatase
MNPDPSVTVIGNARIVLPHDVIEQGWIAMADGCIAGFGEGRAPERGEDAGGDLVMPGLIELHTDHIETHYVPRPKVYWDPVAAAVSYDAQMAASGITTVFDSLRLCREDAIDDAVGEAEILAAALASAGAANLLRAQHFLHLRCEVPMPRVVEEAKALLAGQNVRLISLTDHTPGQRQFRDDAKMRIYYRGKGGLTEAELDTMLAHRIAFQKAHAEDNIRDLVALAQAHAIPLASHDDTTLENVRNAIRDGVSVAEFPTTLEAAAALREAGIAILMGAPNVVRGGSHSGNVAAADLARGGLLDILSSDYIPSRLLMAALLLPRQAASIGLATAIRTVTQAPARAAGLTGRGEIALGKRADIIREHLAGDIPVVRRVWREGQRVA